MVNQSSISCLIFKDNWNGDLLKQIKYALKLTNMKKTLIRFSERWIYEPSSIEKNPKMCVELNVMTALGGTKKSFIYLSQTPGAVWRVISNITLH